MSFLDKLRNKGEKTRGKGLEFLGRARGDRKQRYRGKGVQGKASIKLAGEKVKDAAGNVKGAFKH